MSTNNNVTYTGPGFFTLLGLLFIGLKLTGYVAWSWTMVLLPIWAPLALAVAILLVAGIVYAVTK